MTTGITFGGPLAANQLAGFSFTVLTGRRKSLMIDATDEDETEYANHRDVDIC